METQEAVFRRGQTFTGNYGGGTVTTLGTPQFGWDQEGLEKWFRDINVTTGPPQLRSNRVVKCRCVRNYTSGSASSQTGALTILPSRLVTLDTTDYFARATGYSTTDAAPAVFPVDEWLPSAGVLLWDLFWVVLAGPSLVLTPLDAGADNVINANDLLTSLTAATSQATSAGRVKTQVLTGATQPLAKEINHVFAQALSAATTANTGVTLLVDVGQVW